MKIKINNFNLCESFLELILYKGEPLFKLAGEFHITGDAGHNLQPSCAHGFRIQCDARQIVYKLNFSEK